MMKLTKGMNVRFMVRGSLREGTIDKVETAKTTGNQVVTLKTVEGFRSFKVDDIEGRISIELQEV